MKRAEAAARKEQELLDKMVRAILDGKKTQARMVIEPQPRWVQAESGDRPEMRHQDGVYGAIWYSPVFGGEDGDDVDWTGEFAPCPYGQPGDRIILEITGVKAEHVQEITAKDAVLEGVTIEGEGMLDPCDVASQTIGRFRNQWVWVIEFRREKEK